MTSALVIDVRTTKILDHKEVKPFFRSIKITFVHRAQEIILTHFLVEIVDQFLNVPIPYFIVVSYFHIKM